MEYWNFSKNDDWKRSNCSEMTTIEHIDEHLAHERNKNYYLIKKNESLRNSNQQFATSYETIKMQMNELLQERTALFQKNVSLIYEQNHLKKELMSYKEMLSKTSSRNKALLLNIKAAYDELVRNTSCLDEFIASLPRDNGELQYEGYADEADNDPRFEMNSPHWNRIYPINTVLTPVQEEQPCQSANLIKVEPCSNAKKSRLGRNPLRRIDNVLVLDKTSDNASIKWDPAKENRMAMDLKQDYTLWRKAALQAINSSAKQDDDKDFTVKLKDSNECVEPVKNENSYNSNKTTESDEKRNERTFTLKDCVSGTKSISANENKSTINAQESFIEQKTPIVQDEPKSYQQNEPPKLESYHHMRCFFPPLHEKNEDNHLSKKQDIFEKHPPATPISICKTKLIATPRCQDLSSLSILLRSTDVKCAGEDDDVTSLDAKSSSKDISFISNTSSRQIIKNVYKSKRKLNESKSKLRDSEGKRKKRNSVFTVLDEKCDGAEITGKDLENNMDFNTNLLNGFELKEKSDKNEEVNNGFFESQAWSRQGKFNSKVGSEEKIAKIEESLDLANTDSKKIFAEVKPKEIIDEYLSRDTEPIEPNARNRQKKVTGNKVKIKTPANTRSKRKVDAFPDVVLDGVQTRTRSKKKIGGKGNEHEDDIIFEKTKIEKRATRSKTNKNQKTSSETTKREGRIKKKKTDLKQVTSPIKAAEDQNSTPKIKINAHQKENVDSEKYLPISTPKSIVDSSQPINFNEISISPIGKMIKENEQKTNLISLNKNKIKVNNQKINILRDDEKLHCEQKNEVKSQKKYVVLADLLRSTANHKLATQGDIAQIKRFLVNIGCDDKKIERNSVEEKAMPPCIVTESPREDSGISNNSIRDNITSLLSTLSPSLVSVIKSLEIQDNSMSLEV